MPFSTYADVNPQRPIKRGEVAPFVEMAAVPEGGGPLRYLKERGFDGGGSRFAVGDTLFARITPCTENGKVAKVTTLDGHDVGFGSTEFIVVAAREGVGDPDFVYQVAVSKRVRDAAVGRMLGTSGRQRVPNWFFEDELTLPYFTLAEQRGVAAVLDAALEWAVDNTMDVVNLSLGSSFPSLAMGDAVFATFSAGVVVVASAGNSATSVGYPAGFPYAMAVAAMDEFDFVPFFSSHGPEVDVAGPGVFVLSTFGGGGTAFLNGTSMASPHAAGVATLIRAASPGISADDVREILRNTADDIAAPGYDYFAGWGVVDAEAAVNAVGTADLALSTVPGLLTLAAEPGGSPVTETIEIRNVGAPGTIDWTASEVETWLSLSPTSGTATNVTPGSIDVTADPTGLAPGIYTSFVTVAGNAANSPVQTRVRFAVAPRIVLDATVATAGEIPAGKRTRFVFSGTAGQEIDVAVLTDFGHINPLFEPALRVILPDGETVLAYSDQGFLAGLLFQPLLYRLQLPEDGDYFIEVGAFGDFEFLGSGFILKARPTGPILSLSPLFSALLRTEENGPSDQTDVTVFNLTGVGTIDFDVTTFDPWLSADPTSGTASTSGPLVASASRRAPTARSGAQSSTSWDTLEKEREFRSPQEKQWFEGLELARQWGGSSETVAGPDVAVVTLIGDPTGLSVGSNFGGAEFASDGWLPPFFLSVNFHIYTPGMEIISDGHFSPWGLTTDRPDRAIGATADDGGSLLPIDLAGVLGPAVATGMTPFPADVTTGQDDNWYVGSRSFDFAIVKVMPDGSSETFVTLPGTPFWVATGPDGEFYPTLCNTGEMLRISPDGSVIDPFGPPDLLCPAGVDYNSVDGNIYLVELFGSVRVLDLNGTDLGVVAPNVFAAAALTVGPSGKVYITTASGEVWTYDPSAGIGADAEFLGVAPSPGNLFGVTVLDQWLVFTGINFGEFYRFPVVEGPTPGDIVVRLDADDIVNLGGLAKSIPGEDFRIPLNLELTADAT
ncbi:MAG: S8 family serine peptidase, partial [Acidobacteria bacterium]|nr:S8 family serine peptidase [Acidobacteriota bacterium]